MKEGIIILYHIKKIIQLGLQYIIEEDEKREKQKKSKDKSEKLAKGEYSYPHDDKVDKTHKVRFTYCNHKIYDEKMKRVAVGVVHYDLIDISHDKRLMNFLNSNVSWDNEKRFHAVYRAGDYWVADFKDQKLSYFSKTLEEAKKRARGLNALEDNNLSLLEEAKKTINHFNNSDRKKRYYVREGGMQNCFAPFDSKVNIYVSPNKTEPNNFDEAKLAAHLFNLIEENKI